MVPIVSTAEGEQLTELPGPISYMAEGDEPPFVSYAQNREDVVLWRALRHVTPGRYVDVGAADPYTDSVTASLYERGWRGINIEPVPALAAALLEARPDDVLVACGIGAETGSLELTVVAGTGLSTFDPEAARQASSRGWATSQILVPIRTLDEVLCDRLTPGDEIHVLKVDAEGFEAEVLAGANLGDWRPWVLVVEATAPNATIASHQTWEPNVLAAGYELCLFDGLNRFYVHQDHADLAPSLSYPACPLDARFVSKREDDLDRDNRRLQDLLVVAQQTAVELDNTHRRLEAAERHADELRQRLEAAAQETERRDRRVAELRKYQQYLRSANDAMTTERDSLARANDQLTTNLDHLQAAYQQAIGSVSWRVTAPLRAVRERIGTARGVGSPGAPGSHRPSAQSRRPASDPWAAFERRLEQATALLRGTDPDIPATGERPDPIVNLVDAVAGTDASRTATAWLGYVAARAVYPDEVTMRSEANLLQRLGAHGYVDHLVDLFSHDVQHGRARLDDLDPINGGTAIDLTQTASDDVHTGIQRVVREVASRWLEHENTHGVWWDGASGVLRRLAPDDVDRFRDWRERLWRGEHRAVGVHELKADPPRVLVPWRSRLIVPELAAEPTRAEGIRSLACSDVVDGLSVISYDMIPVTTAETVAYGMGEAFNHYLSMVKRAHRLAAISESAANEFRAFNAALASQGLTGPVVEAHLLPPSPADVDEEFARSFRNRYAADQTPLVLVVGSHEPRKNHVTVLDAADRLWSEGLEFTLVFIGGSGWRSERFESEVERLQAAGRPIEVIRRASEEELWTAYRAARFSVFTALVEGYGLPIVESIASGTPVITTNYGSMAEVAAPGGAVTVDPYDVGALADRMRVLLTQDDELARLAAEAAARVFPSWDTYAEDVWQFLAGGR